MPTYPVTVAAPAAAALAHIFFSNHDLICYLHNSIRSGRETPSAALLFSSSLLTVFRSISKRYLISQPGAGGAARRRAACLRPAVAAEKSRPKWSAIVEVARRRQISRHEIMGTRLPLPVSLPPSLFPLLPSLPFLPFRVFRCFL